MAGAGAQRVGVAAAFGDVVGQGAAGVDTADVQRAVGQGAEAAAAADVGDLKPDAFLGADAHDDDVAFGRQVQGPQGADGCQAGEDAGGAVEVAAMRHRIEMRADHQGRRGAVAAGQGHVEVGGGVVADLQLHGFGGFGNRGVCPLFAGAVRVAGDAGFVQAILAQLVEQRLHGGALGVDRRLDGLGSRSGHGHSPIGIGIDGIIWFKRG